MKINLGNSISYDDPFFTINETLLFARNKCFLPLWKSVIQELFSADSCSKYRASVQQTSKCQMCLIKIFEIEFKC